MTADPNVSAAPLGPTPAPHEPTSGHPEPTPGHPEPRADLREIAGRLAICDEALRRAARPLAIRVTHIDLQRRHAELVQRFKTGIRDALGRHSHPASRQERIDALLALHAPARPWSFVMHSTDPVLVELHRSALTEVCRIARSLRLNDQDIAGLVYGRATPTAAGLADLVENRRAAAFPRPAGTAATDAQPLQR